jgi:hypothetical protein
MQKCRRNSLPVDAHIDEIRANFGKTKWDIPVQPRHVNA